jgi:hypothetical protein
VATDRAHEGAPERGALRWAEVQGGLLTSRPAALAGLADPEGLEVHGARWVDTDAGPRLLLLGGRGGRGAVVVCAADGPELSCAESSLSDGTCADIGPVSSLVPTPRGWLASGPGAFAAAEVSGGAPVGWRCEGPGRPQVTLRRDELPTAVDVRLRAVGRLGGRVFGCAEVEGTGDRVVLFQAPLGPATPFTGAALGWVPIAGAYEGRCGEFSRLPTELAAASPTALLANLMISAVELDETGRAVERGWSSYTGDLGPDPITGALQRAEGWTLFLTGWAVEPRALGAAIVTRGADAPWRAVYGVRDSTAYATLAARDRDFVAYNAFTDGLPLRVTPRPDASAPSGLGAALEVVSQDPASRLMLGGREAVDDSIYVPERGEIWLLGNDHVRPTGGVEDFDDRVWRPFLRRLGPGLERAVDVALPLERGAFLCDAAPLAPGKYLLVGGQGTLLIYDGEVLEPVEVDYDDPDTEAVEVAPFDLNTGESSPDFLAVDAAGGVAWAVGFDALIVRVARERRGGVVRWVGRRISQERVAPGDLRSPIIPRSRFTHVRALAPDRAVLVAQRRPMFVNLGCTAVRRTRNLGDPSDLLQIGPSAGWRQVEAAVSPGAAAPWALGLSSWWPFPALDGPLPEIVPHGLVGPPGGLTVVFWEGRLWREDGAEARTPFYPSAAAYHPDLGWALAGANARVAVGR